MTDSYAPAAPLESDTGVPWVESHQTLANHPKTKRLMRALNIGRVQVVGHLHMLWWWALDYAQDGDLSGYDMAEIADACEWEHNPDMLMRALKQSGFVDDDNRIHDWEQFGGKYFKRQEQSRERQQRYREAHNASVTRDVTDSNASRGEEKREEDKTGEERTNGAGAPAVKAKPRRRIPDTWELTGDLRTYAINHGIPVSEVDEFATEFKRYWQGDGRPKADWDLTFMGRVRDQAGRYQARASPNGTEPRASPAGFARIAQEGLP